MLTHTRRCWRVYHGMPRVHECAVVPPEHRIPRSVAARSICAFRKQLPPLLDTCAYSKYSARRTLRIYEMTARQASRPNRRQRLGVYAAPLITCALNILRRLARRGILTGYRANDDG